MTPEQQARLTLKQKFGLYWPERTKEGAVLIPDADGRNSEDVAGTDDPLTLSEELQRLDVLAAVLKMPPEKAEELRAALRKKFEATSEATNGNLT